MDTTSAILLALFIVMIVGGIIIWIVLTVKDKMNESNLIANYNQIQKGMSRDAVIQIMGANFTRTVLKNDIEKLEWRYQKNGRTISYSGVRKHISGYTRRVSIKFKNNIVVEISALNMD